MEVKVDDQEAAFRASQSETGPNSKNEHMFLTYIYHLLNMFGDGGRVHTRSHSRSPLRYNGGLHWSYRLRGGEKIKV